MTLWHALGWLGQALFFARFFVQWIASERAGSSVAPRTFWWCSILGALLTGAYAWHIREFLLLAVLAVTLCIYVRNLTLSSVRLKPAHRAMFVLAGTTALALILSSEFQRGAPASVEHLAASLNDAWRAVGILGGILWTARFPLQWYLSERAGRSHFPATFWWCSLLGNALLLAYSLRLGDPIFIAGFLPGPLIQVRNLILIYRATPERTVAPMR